MNGHNERGEGMDSKLWFLVYLVIMAAIHYPLIAYLTKGA